MAAVIKATAIRATVIRATVIRATVIRGEKKEPARGAEDSTKSKLQQSLKLRIARAIEVEGTGLKNEGSSDSTQIQM